MDYQTYQKNYFTDPPPEQRYNFTGNFGVTLFYQDYVAAITYYERVLGPPAYVEGDGTRGWRIGQGWLTLLKGKSGNPRNLAPRSLQVMQHKLLAPQVSHRSSVCPPSIASTSPSPRGRQDSSVKGALATRVKAC